MKSGDIIKSVSYVAKDTFRRLIEFRRAGMG